MVNMMTLTADGLLTSTEILPEGPIAVSSNRCGFNIQSSLECLGKNVVLASSI